MRPVRIVVAVVLTAAAAATGSFPARSTVHRSAVGLFHRRARWLAGQRHQGVALHRRRPQLGRRQPSFSTATARRLLGGSLALRNSEEL